MKHVVFAALVLFAGASAFAEDINNDGPLPALADADSDGKVTMGEYQNSRRTFLMRADANQDGKINQDEWTKGSDRVREDARLQGVNNYQMIGKGDLFARLDANEDSFVIPEEIDAAAAVRFRKLDLNGDGAVDRAEVKQLTSAFDKSTGQQG